MLFSVGLPFSDSILKRVLREMPDWSETSLTDKISSYIEKSMGSNLSLSDRVKNLKPSAVFELLQKANNLKKQGRDVISLSVGEPVWNTYDKIKQAGKRAIDEGYTKYTPSAGIPELRVQISKRMSEDFGFPVKSSHIVAASGSKQALFALFQCLCDSGDEVILPAPYWVSYRQIMELSGAVSKIVSCDEKTGFKITPSQLRAAITEKTKGFLLNSPNNPTSAVYTEEELKALGEELRQHPGIFIITDDIYDRLVFEGSHSPHLLSLCPDLKDRTFCVNGVSKIYLMTGWRLAWITGPEKYIQTLSAFQSQSIGCASSIAQKAVADELLECDQEIKELIQKLIPLRNQLSQTFKALPGVKPYPSEGAFYLWVNVQDIIGRFHKGEKILSSFHLVEQLLQKADLICVSGESFEAPGYLRFSYGVNKSTLDKACQRLSEFFKSVKS